jgi:hypothetical protein
MSGDKLFVTVEACAICDKDRDWRDIPDGVVCGHDPGDFRELRKVEVIPVDAPNVLSEAEAQLVLSALDFIAETHGELDAPEEALYERLVARASKEES